MRVRDGEAPEGGGVSIIRKVQRTSYTVVDNAVLRDARLSWRATGLLSYLLSLPDGWRVNHTDLARRKRDGKDSTLAAMTELVDAGYVERRKEHDEKGRIHTVTLVYEEPVGSTMELADSPDAGLPDPVEPDAGFRGGIVSTKEGTTQEQVTKDQEHIAPKNESAFPLFWEVYPRKAGKRAAETAWDNALKRGVSPALILFGAERFRDDPNRDPAYTPHPATWLNQDRWLDDPLPARSGGKGGSVANILAMAQRADDPLQDEHYLPRAT